MPVKVINTETVDFDAKRTVISSTTVRCDGPKCNKEVSVCPGTLTWTENHEKPGENIPDAFYRMLVLSDALGSKRVFLSAKCLHQFMQTYTAPLSPREKAEIVKANTAVAEKKGEVITMTQTRAGVPEVPPPADTTPNPAQENQKETTDETTA